MEANLAKEVHHQRAQPRWHIRDSWADPLQLKVATGGAFVEEPCVPVTDDIPRYVCKSLPT